MDFLGKTSNHVCLINIRFYPLSVCSLDIRGVPNKCSFRQVYFYLKILGLKKDSIERVIFYHKRIANSKTICFCMKKSFDFRPFKLPD